MQCLLCLRRKRMKVASCYVEAVWISIGANQQGGRAQTASESKQQQQQQQQQQHVV
jgi:hypothetical protein